MIREHIKNNFKNDSKEMIKDAIESSIKDNDEITLPGLGVFMEIIWNNIDKNLKDKLLDTIKDNLGAN